MKRENREASELPEPKDEAEIWAGKEGEELHKIMAGYVDTIVFKKEEDSAETTEVYGRNYESILVDSKVTGKVKYSSGLSQVIRELIGNTPLKPTDIQDSCGKGVVMFRNSPLIDVVRQIAEELNWTFHVDYDKVFHFHPYVETKSVKTLDLKDALSYKIEKH